MFGFIRLYNCAYKVSTGYIWSDLSLSHPNWLYPQHLVLLLPNLSVITEHQTKHRKSSIYLWNRVETYVGMNWEWRDVNARGQSPQPHCIAPMVTGLMVTRPPRHPVSSLDTFCLEHGRPQESALLTTHTCTHTQNKRWRWKKEKNEETRITLSVCPCRLLWLPWRSCGYPRFLQVETER